ncbi:Histidine phosphatase superfamily (branch 1) [Rosistilla carotiformis]|uniref:Histidine phosphatase superfamily (Branch 1) n=1 Tax=Rosistilla carotiformis TaxID=2528017 RepID=A0A518JWP0_9BACT|nr:phosphoglycerate mutase family protein [Rosistilla carotiformis]QDV69958.1 Histidine phosphatase superfamily (branch 1) [Rosistilla carotiformis]
MNRLNSRIEDLANRSTSARTICQSLFGLWVVLGTLNATPLFAQTDPHNATTTFLVVRHAERDGNLDKLTKTGQQRSQILASLGRALNVQAIYSTDTQRTKGTVQPLATAAGTEIRIYETPSKDWIASLAHKHAGEVVLIVGHSNTAGAIAGMLAKRKHLELAHDEYDALFIIRQSASETQSLRLRYGASSAGASSADPDKMGTLVPTR